MRFLTFSPLCALERLLFGCSPRVRFPPRSRNSLPSRLLARRLLRLLRRKWCCVGERAPTTKKKLTCTPASATKCQRG